MVHTAPVPATTAAAVQVRVQCCGLMAPANTDTGQTELAEDSCAPVASTGCRLTTDELVENMAVTLAVPRTVGLNVALNTPRAMNDI